MLLQARSEALDGDVLRHGEHERGTGCELTGFEPAGRHDGHAIDVGPSRLDLHVQSLLRVVAELLGHDFADLIVARQPTQLQVDGRFRSALRQGVERQQTATQTDATKARSGLEQGATARIAKLG